MRISAVIKKLDPWFRSALALALVAVTVQSVWQTTERVRARSRYSGDDIVTYNQKRWDAVHTFLKGKLPAGPLGYLLVADKGAVPEDARFAQYYSSQFVLWPWWLEQDLSNATLRWAVADFMGVSQANWTPPAGWRVAHSYPEGITLLQRSETVEAPAL